MIVTIFAIFVTIITMPGWSNARVAFPILLKALILFVNHAIPLLQGEGFIAATAVNQLICRHV